VDPKVLIWFRALPVVSFVIVFIRINMLKNFDQLKRSLSLNPKEDFQYFSIPTHIAFNLAVEFSMILINLQWDSPLDVMILGTSTLFIGLLCDVTNVTLDTLLKYIYYDAELLQYQFHLYLRIFLIQIIHLVLYITNNKNVITDGIYLGFFLLNLIELVAGKKNSDYYPLSVNPTVRNWARRTSVPIVEEKGI